MAAGPRDVMVPASGADTARDVLLEADMLPTEQRAVTSPARLLAGILIGVALIAIVVWLGSEIIT